jgi:hypothetical protein
MVVSIRRLLWRYRDGVHVMNRILHASAQIRDALLRNFHHEPECVVFLDRSDWMGLRRDVEFNMIATADLCGGGPDVNGLLIGGVRYKVKGR